ncbi:MAG: SdrD B-like domain-containing protein, partial [Bacteroidota bacterium]
GASFGYEIEFCIAGGQNGFDPFPYEIRNFYLPELSALKIPPGLSLDYYEIDRYRYTESSGTSRTRNDLDVTAYAKVVDGYMVVDWDDIFNDGTFNANPSNGGFNMRLFGEFDGSCNSETSVAEWYHQSLQDYCAPTLVAEVIRDSGMHSSNLNIVIPNLDLSTTNTATAPIEPTDEIAGWSLIIEETEGQPATNSWAVFHDPAGKFNITGVSRGATTYSAVNGVWDLGTIGGGTTNSFSLDVNYTGCGFDSLMVLVGWDCDAIPTSDLQALAGGLPCGSDTIYLYIDPASGTLQQAIITEPTAPVDPCTSFDYEILIQNVKSVTLYEPQFEIFIPYSLGLEITPGSEEICYPCNTSSPTYNILAPVSDTIYLPQGVKFVWNLEDLVAAFDWDDGVSPTGLTGLTGSDEDRTIQLKFSSQINCDFIGGDYIRLRTLGNTYCGEEIKTLVRTGTAIEINGATTPYIAGITTTVDGEPIDGCSTTTNYVVDGEIAFQGTTDGQDSIIIALPPAFSYESVVFNPAHVSNQTPIIITYGPSAGNPTTFQELRWAVNSGIAAFTTIPYSLSVNNNPDEVLCDDENLISVRTVRSTSSSCGATVCSMLTETGKREKSVEIRKDAFIIDDFVPRAPCGMTQLFIDDLILTDTGGYAINEEITISFYHDADGDGMLSVGDTLLGEAINSSPIPAYGSVSLSAGPFTVTPERSCRILAVASGCTCAAPTQNARILRLENAGTDQTGCNSDVFNLGCGEDLRGSGFYYEWFGLDGAPVDSLNDVNDPNTTLSYTHLNGSPLTLQYVLLTQHPSGVCNSFDTISLTLDGVAVVTGPIVKVCPSDVGTLSGPTGFYDYLWSPTTGITDPTDPNTTVVAPVGSQTYTLRYKSLDGCDKYFSQIVQGANCTDLELNKTVDQATANIGDVITYRLELINQGPNGMDGIEVTDSLPIQLSFLSTDPNDGNYNATTGVWTIPGVMLPGDTLNRVIYARVDSLGGPVFNTTEVTDMTGADTDSTPDNDDETEDDQDGVCTSVNVTLECREEKTIGVPDEFTSYQWYKDGLAITGATTNQLTVTESGSYEIQVDGGSCPYGNCCPFIVTEDPCAAIGNYVWEDMNKDGIQDGGENGIENVKVYLYESVTGEIYDSTFTDASGLYTFTEVASNTYYLIFDVSTTTSTNSYQLTDRAQGDGTNDSEPITINATTPNFAFDASLGDDNTHDAGYVPYANIGDYVFADLDMDGIQDLFDTPVDQVTVRLYDADTDALIDTDLTDTDGLYLFEDVLPGDYYIIFDLSTTTGVSDYGFTGVNTGTGLNDNEADANGRTAVFTFDPRSGDDLGHDAGIVPPADLAIDKTVSNINPEIGETITFTVKVVNEGTIDAAGVEVTEQLQSGFTYVNDDSGGNYNSSTGLWSVGSIAAGDSATINIAATVVAAGIYDNTAEISGMFGRDVDSDPSTGIGTDDLTDGVPDDDEDELTVVPGETFDLSLDKVIQPGQVSGFDLGDNVKYDITITNEGDITATNIKVVDNIPAGMVLSPDDTNGWVAVTSTEAEVTIAGPLTPGNSSTIEIVLRVEYGGSGASITNNAQITEVFNEDGFPVTDTDSEPDNDDPAEDDYGTETITLLEHDPTGFIYCDKTGYLITGGTITVTGPNGIPNDEVVILKDGSDGTYEYYEVGSPGVYTITYTHPDGLTLSPDRLPLAGPYDVTSGPDPTIFGSDTLGGFLIDTTTAANPYYLSFDVEDGDPIVYNNNLPVQCVFIGAVVCEDTDANNTSDGTEPGMANAIVRLFDCADTTTVLREVTTDGDGNYRFDGLQPGDYRIQFVSPGSYAPVDGSVLDDNNMAPCVTLDWGDCDTSTSVCFTLLANVGNFFWNDIDGDGIQDAGEPGLANVKVSLYNATSTVIVDSTYTDSNGEYLFEGVPGSDYYVIFEPEGSGIIGYEFTTTGAGNTVSDNNADAAGRTADFTFNPYDGDDLSIDGGVVLNGDIGDRVWLDEDNDGVQDGSETTGIQNVTVTLYDANSGAVVATDITDAAGAYLFVDIPAGNYYVNFDTT